MSKTTSTLPQPPSLWKSIGPSFILLGLALGSGELILWPYLAANYGLGLLWGALLGITFQFVLNTEVMRYSLAWGESVFVGFRRLSRAIPAWFIFSTFIPWSLPGFSSASAELLSGFMPQVPVTLIALGLLVLVGAILSFGPSLYKTMESFQTLVILIGLPFLFYLSFDISQPHDWSLALQGLVGKGEGFWFFPSGVGTFAFLGAFAYSGAGGNLNLAQSYYIKEKGFGMGAFSAKITSLFSQDQKPVALEGKTFSDTPQNRQRWNAWWQLINREHFLVFWVLGFVTIVILSVLAKATVFGQATESGLSFIYTEALVVGEHYSPQLGRLFLLITALTLFSTQVGVLESSTRIISENILLLLTKKGQKVHASKWFYGALWSQIAIGAAVYLAGFSEPRLLLTLSAVLNAAAMMFSFLLIWILNRARLPKKIQPSKVRVVTMATAFCFFLYFLVITLQEYLA